MAHSDCKLKITRSRDDHEFYQVALLKYDPNTIARLFLQVAPTQRIRPQQTIATLLLKNHPNQETQEQSTRQVLSMSYAGTVEAVGEGFERTVWEGREVFVLRQGQGKGKVELLSFRECDHSPQEETFLNGSFGETVKKGYSQSLALCEWCQTALWKYYDKLEVSISLGQLCRLNSLQDAVKAAEQLEWSIALNEQFTKTTEVGRVGEVQITLPFLAKATFLLGIGERRRVREDTVVMRLRRVVCKHEKVVEGRCQFCMQQVRQEHLSQFSTYLFQKEGGSGVLVTGSALKHHEQIFVDNMLAQCKAIIILDLDNTILHSTEISDLDLNTVVGLDEFYLIPKLECPFQQEKGKRDLIVVKMRPYFKQFIYVLSKLYEIYVYTKGTRVYAQEICKYIRAQYAGEQQNHPYCTWQPEKLLFLQHKKSFATNIISRDEDSNLESKSFERILPTKTDYHLILDDRRDVWNNSPSWFFTREYYYFLNKAKRPQDDPALQIDHYLTTDIPLPEMKGQLVEEYKQVKAQYPQKKDIIMETNNRKDYFLLFAAYALKKIHKNFFEALINEAQAKESREVKEGKEAEKRKFNKINLAYQYARTKIFYKGYKFHFFLGEGQNQNNNNTIRRAKKMGATIAEESSIISTNLENIVIRANDLMKQSKKAQMGPISSEGQQSTTVLNGSEGEYYEKEKKQLNELFQKKIPVVCESWIHYCYQFNYPFAYDEFRLFDPFQLDVNHEDYIHVVQKQAKLILSSIEQQMQREMNGEKKQQGADRKETHHLHGIRHKRERKEGVGESSPLS